jgi:pyrroline-5-carboxylate reductase
MRWRARWSTRQERLDRKRLLSQALAMSTYSSILFVGCGNMGGAMLQGWLRAGIDPARFTIVDPVLAEAPYGVTLLRAMPQAAFDAIVLGVKPQLLDAVCPSVEPLAGQGTTLFSMLAGVELDALGARFPRAGAIVRLMPNLSAALGKSPVALAERGLDDAGRDGVVGLMRHLGHPEWVPEGQFDLVTALAGSGPAFLYRFIDALAQGAGALGMDRAQADRLALATVEGAAALAAQSEHAPGELARRVASAGGTTQAGLDALDKDAGLARIVEATLRAARDRGAEMAAAARKG